MRTLFRIERIATIAAVVLGAVMASGCDYGLGPTPATTTTTTTTTTTGSGGGGSTTSVTYVKDVAPILNSDCVSCHGPSRRDAGVDVSTYAGVMRIVSAGNANSKLIKVTQAGGLMYSQLSGNRTQKAATIRDWIVTYGAVQQ